MSTFAVTPTTLEALQQALVGFAQELLNGAQTQGADSQGILSIGDGGNSGPGGAIDEFIDAWESSLAVTGQTISNVADKLGEAAQSYDTTDSTIQDVIGSYTGAPLPPAQPRVTVPGDSSRQNAGVNAYTGS